MFYVTMTDGFLSGWGRAEGKINKLVIECKTYEEAEIVKDNAEHRSEMKYINIAIKKPYYGSRYYVNYETKETYPCWFVAGYFRNQK